LNIQKRKFTYEDGYFLCPNRELFSLCDGHTHEAVGLNTKMAQTQIVRKQKQKTLPKRCPVPSSHDAKLANDSNVNKESSCLSQPNARSISMNPKPRTVFGRVFHTDPAGVKTRFELRKDGVHVKRYKCSKKKSRRITFTELLDIANGQFTFKI